MNRPDDLYPEHWRALLVEKEAMPQSLRKSPRVGHHHVDPLTVRERQIVRVMAEGLTNKEIAQRLRLAEGTVKVHLHRIYRKLGIANRTPSQSWQTLDRLEDCRLARHRRLNRARNPVTEISFEDAERSASRNR